MSSQPPKDFLALTHGHEWVNFYESFDKLVQDHLSRSSELLQKAMSLPEVADREVAELRENLETQLKTERTQANETLTALRDDISTTQQQAVSVAALTAQLAADLEKLSERVDGALAALINSGDEIAASLDAITDMNDAPSELADGDAVADVDAMDVSSEVEPFEVEDDALTAEAESSDHADDEAVHIEVIAEDEGAAEILESVSMDDLSEWAAVEDEFAAADDAGEIDLSALAAAETGLPIEEVEQKIGTGELGMASAKPDTNDLASILEAADGESELAASAASNGNQTGERARPHWLSMTRPSSEQN